MSAAKLSLLVEQGATFSRVFQLREGDAYSAPVDLTGYAARAQVRADARSTAVMLTPTVSVASPGTLGRISFTITDAQSSALALSGANADEVTTGVWDLEIYSVSTGVVLRVLSGPIMFSPEVTRAD